MKAHFLTCKPQVSMEINNKMANLRYYSKGDLPTFKVT